MADIAPVWEGAIQHNAVKRFEIAGQDLTDLLAKEFAKTQPNVKLDLATVEMLKEKYATVCEDPSAYAATAEACPKIEHTLPDGQVHIFLSGYLNLDVLGRLFFKIVLIS